MEFNLKYIQLAIIAISIVATKSGSFRVDNMRVTITKESNVNHFTFAEALTAGELVLKGRQGIFPIGAIEIEISPWTGN